MWALEVAATRARTVAAWICAATMANSRDDGLGRAITCTAIPIRRHMGATRPWETGAGGVGVLHAWSRAPRYRKHQTGSPQRSTTTGSTGTGTDQGINDPFLSIAVMWWLWSSNCWLMSSISAGCSHVAW
jgi:hypothetical protein